MRALVCLFLILATVATTMACLPVTDLQQENTPLATGTIAPALSALKHVSPRPPSPTVADADPASSYPYPATPTAIPYPYPSDMTEEPWVPSDPMDIFLATRAAEMMVPRLEGDMLHEAIQLFEGTRQAAQWQEMDKEMLQYLVLSWEPIVELQPGETYSFSVGLHTSIFYTFPAIEIQKTWHLSPTVGAKIDPDTGFLTIDQNTPSGTVYTVTADVENGRAAPSIDVYVYTPEENPLVGHWHEEKQVTCSDEEEIIPSQRMDELRFLSDGTFTVVWFVFEDIHSDYWGTYDYDLVTGELILNVEDSTYMPPDIDGSGYAVVDGGNRLVLENIWLGKPQSGQGSTNCGHIFVRS